MEFKPFRKRVRAEFQPTCLGKQITFNFQRNGRWKAFSQTKVITPTIKIGLRTKDATVYKQRLLEAELTMSRELQRISELETGLEHEKVVSLASRFYEDYRLQTETSAVFVHCTEATVSYSRQRAIWRLKMGKTGIRAFDELCGDIDEAGRLAEIVNSFFKVHRDDDLSPNSLEAQFGMLLSAYGPNPNIRDEDRYRILIEMRQIMLRCAASNDMKPPEFFIEHGLSKADADLFKESMDYAKKYERQIARMEPTADKVTPLKKVTWHQLLQFWKMEKPVAADSVKSWENVVRVAIDIFGHDEVSCLRKGDFLRWKEAMLNHPTIGIKTAKQNHLTALNRLINVGVHRELLEANFLKGVRIYDDAEPNDEEKEYTHQEVRSIIETAATSTDPVYRWIPLILSLSGARCKEVTSLWHDQIECHNGVWVFWLRKTKDGIKPKNASSYRRIPIHSYLLEAGFLNFVRTRQGLPLFYNPPEVYGRYHPAGVLVTRVGEYIKSIRACDCKKQPTHGFRHYVISFLRRIEPDGDKRDAIVGHKLRGEQDTYGSQWLEGLKRVIDQFPTP